MTKKITLNADLRDEKSTTPNDARRAGFVPAVLYGPKTKNTSLKIKKTDFIKALDIAGETNLIDLKVGDKAYKVLIKEVQRDNFRDLPMHVDFYQVDMEQEVTVDVPLNFIGVAHAVKDLGGTLIKAKDHITLTSLPGDMADHVDVDISKLVTFDDNIRYKDIALPEKNTFAGDPEDLVVTTEMPRSQRVGGEDEEGTEVAGEAKTEATAEGEKEGKEEAKKK